MKHMNIYLFKAYIKDIETYVCLNANSEKEVWDKVDKIPNMRINFFLNILLYLKLLKYFLKMY